jgi:sulfite oxidase
MWGTRDDMVVHDEQPFNAEPQPSTLAGQDLTPIEAFYSRNHGPAPDLDPAAWRLRVGGLVDDELVLSLADLQRRFLARSEVATLACAGNRRAELLAVRPVPGQVPWGPATISTAAWTGVRLADVLDAAGLRAGRRTSPSRPPTWRRASGGPTGAPSR